MYASSEIGVFPFSFDLKAVDPAYSKTVPIGIAIRRPFSSSEKCARLADPYSISARAGDWV